MYMYLYIIVFVYVFRLNNEQPNEEGNHLAEVMATRTTRGWTNGMNKRAPTEGRCGDVHIEQIVSTTVRHTFYRSMMAHLQRHITTTHVLQISVSDNYITAILYSYTYIAKAVPCIPDVYFIDAAKKRRLVLMAKDKGKQELFTSASQITEQCIMEVLTAPNDLIGMYSVGIQL